MEIKEHKIDNITIAEIISDKLVIQNEQEALELMMNCIYRGADYIIVPKQNIIPTFFDLKTGLAGAVFQKFSNYKAYLAIIGDFSKINSQSLKDFILESNKIGRVNFLNSIEEAIKVFTKA
jgi:Domain of unknown function (DUF4180)